MTFPLQAEAFHVVLVMPCLNEAANLMATCSALGFGGNTEQPAEPAALVIVDNGSEDDTWQVAEQIQRTSLANSVHLVRETTRGFVPARHRGNVFARTLANSSDWNPEHVLILQVDADCQYLPGYVNAMRVAVQSQTTNVMLEACIGYPMDFKAKYPEYVNICDRTDTEFEKLFPRSLSHDDVPVDAVCGYRLSDYFRWGGHRREFNRSGEEIYAGTTRLFMRARTQGAERFRVGGGNGPTFGA